MANCVVAPTKFNSFQIVGARRPTGIKAGEGRRNVLALFAIDVLNVDWSATDVVRNRRLEHPQCHSDAWRKSIDRRVEDAPQLGPSAQKLT